MDPANAAGRVARLLAPMVVATAIVSAQTPPQQTTPSRPGQQGTVFQATANYVSNDVRVYDKQQNFISDLQASDFHVFEDGVEQKIANFIPYIGGRALNATATVGPSAPPVEGLVMPRSAPPPDTAGRIFIIFIDDLHLQAKDTSRARNVLKLLRDTIIHPNDLVGIVSSGYSSIATDLTYDYNHRRLDEAIHKTMGGAMTPEDIIMMPDTSQGPAGLRYNAHVAFSLANDILMRAAKYTNKRKAFLYISSGYDFNPFQDSRLQHEQDKYSVPAGSAAANSTDAQSQLLQSQYQDAFAKQGQQFAETDLVAELAQLTREANRANVTFYTIDPRGLTAGPDINENLTAEEWRDFIQTSQSSLRVLADETGGIAVVNTNNFKPMFEQIDAQMSDYYIIGYYSSNPDPLKFVRKVKITVDRPDLTLNYRPQYTIKRPSIK